MQIALSKDSDVPLRQQVAEQIVFQITTGQLKAGEELPSVRALGRISKVHHNTVSEAYQDLARRGWITRRPGSRLVVGKLSSIPEEELAGLDELINETITRARDMGFTLQALRARVRERLLEQVPDHVLVVEREAGLRKLICREVQEALKCQTRHCSFEDLAREPGLAIGAQVVVPNHHIPTVKPFAARTRPPLGIVYSEAAEHVSQVRKLEQPSIISIVSVSEGVLRTARCFLAPAIQRHHTLNEVLVTKMDSVALDNSDLVFCDSMTFDIVRAREKRPYRLLAPECLIHLAAAFDGLARNPETFA